MSIVSAQAAYMQIRYNKLFYCIIFLMFKEGTANGIF